LAWIIKIYRFRSASGDLKLRKELKEKMLVSDREEIGFFRVRDRARVRDKDR